VSLCWCDNSVLARLCLPAINTRRRDQNLSIALRRVENPEGTTKNYRRTQYYNHASSGRARVPSSYCRCSSDAAGKRIGFYYGESPRATATIPLMEPFSNIGVQKRGTCATELPGEFLRTTYNTVRLPTLRLTDKRKGATCANACCKLNGGCSSLNCGSSYVSCSPPLAAPAG
jgi:hypothetical protein